MKYLVLVLVYFSLLTSSAQQVAFPGAEGGGKYAFGGRGGKIIFVDNLNDKGNGSFRKAIEAKGPRTIIFRISGTIELQKTIHIKNGDLTIAGQTAPGDGICLKNYGMRVDADNVIVRFIRVRPGDEMHQEMDAISVNRHKNIIIDHCSFSWSVDETASFYENENFTLQWCIVSESLYKSAHHKGEHGFGGIWGGLNASFHHNLLSDHTSRNPRLQGSRYTNNPETEKTDFRNNLIYNWGYNTIYGGEEGYYNIVNNYFKAGPATKKDKQNRILELTQSFYSSAHNADTLQAGKFYITGNTVEGFPEISANNWNGGVQLKGINEEIKNKSKLNTPVEHTAIVTSNARTAGKAILKYAGASLSRDAVDKRIVKEVKTKKETFGHSFEGGGNGIIDSQLDVGGWPNLKLTTPPPDSDNDGMPDKWEKRMKLNPKQADNNDYTLNNSYTNLEMFINSLVNKTIKK